MFNETLLLPQNEVAVFRSLERTATVLLIIFRLDLAGRTPVTRNQIAALLDISRPTAGEYLESLTYQGILTRTGYHSGYTLTNAGRQLVLGQALEGQALDLGSPQALKDPKQALALGQPQALTSPVTEAVTEATALDLEYAESRVKKDLTLESRVKNLLTLKEEEENLKLKSEELPPPPSLSDCDFLTLLEHSEKLFGPPGVVTKGLPPKLDYRMVLAWMAQGYDQRTSLDRPAGLVYRRLQDGTRPRQKYMDEPENYLPGDYLEAIGMNFPIDDEEAAVDNTANTDEIGWNSLHPSLHVCPSSSRYTPLHAFERIWEDLERSTQRGTFVRWLAPVQPLRFEEGTFVLGAVDDDMRTWLAERMTRTIQPSVEGYLNQRVQIVFEVM